MFVGLMLYLIAYNLIEMSGKSTQSQTNLSSYKRNNRSNASANFRTHQAEYFYETPIYEQYSEFPFNDPEMREMIFKKLNMERALAEESLLAAEARNKNKKRRSTRKNRRNNRLTRKRRS